MDPDESLKVIRALKSRILNHALAEDEMKAASMELAETIDALDGWLSKGGFLPKAWRKGK